MFGLKKSPLRLGKHKTADPVYLNTSHKNPFDSDDESEAKPKLNPARRTSSEPSLFDQDSKTNPFDDNHDHDHDHMRGVSSSSHSQAVTYSARNKYKNDFRDSGGMEGQSVQELEGYALYKAEETTKSVNNCLKIAEDMREDATKTLVMLHQQGEQITRTHAAAANIDYDLSRGEKLLGNLGGIFSKTWKPKKTRQIQGPVITGDYADEAQRKGSHMEQREKLGLAPIHKDRSKTRTLQSVESDDPYQKVEVEHAKQDDALSDLSNMLGELKDMAIDMGTEIERHNKAIDHTYGDIDELTSRVRGASERGRRLLGK